MKETLIRYAVRALHTAWQAAAAAAIAAIGSAQTVGAVDWKTVASTAVLAAALSLMKSSVIGVPEANDSSAE